MRKKMGLLVTRDLSMDKTLITDFMKTLHATNADMTRAFRALGEIPSFVYKKLKGSYNSNEILQKEEQIVMKFVDCTSLPRTRELRKLKTSVDKLREYESASLMDPLSIWKFGKTPHWLQEQLAILKNIDLMAKEINTSTMSRHKMLWRDWLTEYWTRMEREVEDCDDIGQVLDLEKGMNLENPKFTLRSHLLKHAIRKAEELDFSEILKLFERIKSPYEDHQLDYYFFHQVLAGHYENNYHTCSS